MMFEQYDFPLGIICGIAFVALLIWIDVVISNKHNKNKH